MNDIMNYLYVEKIAMNGSMRANMITLVVIIGIEDSNGLIV